MLKDQIGDRMKDYEKKSRVYLDKKVPVILRIDGKAFHTYTRGCEKPFDRNLIQAMNSIAETLLEEMQNAVMAYVQSDEISVVMDDTSTDTTDTWFGNEVQKIVSVGASLATAALNRSPFGIHRPPAHFDCRAWSHPEDDVPNYFFWRYLDAKRNAISMVAHNLFGTKNLEGVKTSQRLEMINDKLDYESSFTSRERYGGLVLREDSQNIWVSLDSNSNYYSFKEAFDRGKESKKRYAFNE